MFRWSENRLINSIDSNIRQDNRKNMIFQFNKILTSWYIPSNLLNLWVDGISKSDSLISKYGFDKERNDLTISNNDIEEQENIANWFNKKLSKLSYDRPSKTDYMNMFKKIMLHKVDKKEITREQMLDTIFDKDRQFDHSTNRFEDIVSKFNKRDIIINKLLEVVVWDYIHYILSSLDKKCIYKVYNTNLYDDVISGVDFIIEATSSKGYKTYTAFDLTSSSSKIETKSNPSDFFISQWLPPRKIDRKILKIDNFNIIYKYLAEYMDYMYHNETTNISNEDMRIISKTVKDSLSIDGNMLSIKEDLLKLIA